METSHMSRFCFQTCPGRFWYITMRMAQDMNMKLFSIWYIRRRGENDWIGSEAVFSTGVWSTGGSSSSCVFDIYAVGRSGWASFDLVVDHGVLFPKSELRCRFFVCRKRESASKLKARAPWRAWGGSASSRMKTKATYEPINLLLGTCNRIHNR